MILVETARVPKLDGKAVPSRSRRQALRLDIGSRHFAPPPTKGCQPVREPDTGGSFGFVRRPSGFFGVVRLLADRKIARDRGLEPGT